MVGGPAEEGRELYLERRKYGRYGSVEMEMEKCWAHEEYRGSRETRGGNKGLMWNGNMETVC